MRDYGEDDEREQRVVSEEKAADRWDGWGTPRAADLGQPGYAEASDMDRRRQLGLVQGLGVDWDGWGDPPSSETDGSAGGRDSLEAQESSIRPATKVGRSDEPSDALPPQETRAIDQARSAVDAAFQQPPDVGFRGEGESPFRERVRRSEAWDTNSLTEAEDYARDNIGIERVDYRGFDERVAKELNAHLEVLRDKYPSVESSKLEYLGTIQQRNADMKSEQPELASWREPELAEPRPELVAVALRDTSGYNGISFNETWVKDYDQATADLREGEARGVSSRDTGSIGGVAAHEFGHLIEYHLRDAGQFTPDLQRALDNIWLRGPDAVNDRVSVYANKSQQELFAELFAEYQISPEPREDALGVGIIIDRLLGIC